MLLAIMISAVASAHGRKAPADYRRNRWLGALLQSAAPRQINDVGVAGHVPARSQPGGLRLARAYNPPTVRDRALPLPL